MMKAPMVGLAMLWTFSAVQAHGRPAGGPDAAGFEALTFDRQAIVALERSLVLEAYLRLVDLALVLDPAPQLVNWKDDPTYRGYALYETGSAKVDEIEDLRARPDFPGLIEDRIQALDAALGLVDELRFRIYETAGTSPTPIDRLRSQLVPATTADELAQLSPEVFAAWEAAAMALAKTIDAHPKGRMRPPSEALRCDLIATLRRGFWSGWIRFVIARPLYVSNFVASQYPVFLNYYIDKERPQAARLARLLGACRDTLSFVRPARFLVGDAHNVAVQVTRLEDACAPRWPWFGNMRLDLASTMVEDLQSRVAWADFDATLAAELASCARTPKSSSAR